MAIKNLSIGQVGFNSMGLVDYFSAGVDKDGVGSPVVIYVIRSITKKEFELSVESVFKIKLPLRTESKLRRLVAEYDKLGKKSINL